MCDQQVFKGFFYFNKLAHSNTYLSSLSLQTTSANSDVYFYFSFVNH